MTPSSSAPSSQQEATLIGLSASEIARGIATGHLSSQEVVEAHIRRIEMVNPRLNAVVVPLFEQARAQAIHADRLREQGTLLGPLHGVPITLKEQFLVSGTPTTVGLMSYKSQIMEHEGPLVTRLRQAGAIILGKTNVSQLLLFGEACNNPVYGRTNNPWDLARTPGGSSGGEAAIIAAGGSPLGLGGDIGGSIRLPAHFCGLYSLLPTARRLTGLDTAPHAEVAGQEAIIAQSCPLARSTRDLRLAMSILAAPGLKALDPSVPPVPWPSSTVSLAGLRIGMYTDNGVFSVAPAVRRAVEEAAQILRAHGAIVEPWSPPDVAKAVQLYISLLSADGFATYKRLLRGNPSDSRIRFNIRMIDLPGVVRASLAGLLRQVGQVRLASALQSLRGALYDSRNNLAAAGVNRRFWITSETEFSAQSFSEAGILGRGVPLKALYRLLKSVCRVCTFGHFMHDVWILGHFIDVFGCM
ncbi:MAG TPA: amidase family protein [Ktedonobacteraceae bacterium]|nr:amidase family protein [Ktedonobacteraceae bacterium]